jgi:hypothetical protein
MDTVLRWILPEVFISSLGISRRRLALILGATLSFMAVVGVVCLVLLGKEEKTARESATRFATALVHNDPAAAPDGAGDYVPGVRDYFGPVTSAKIVGAHNKGVNTGDNADTRAFFVVEMLLQSKRGPAVIELEYDNHALLSQKVSRIYELEPKKAPGLSTRERSQLGEAFQSRGAKPADAGRLSSAEKPKPQITPLPISKPAKPHITKPEATPQGAKLRCIQRAHGDVLKMQKCVS